MPSPDLADARIDWRALRRLRDVSRLMLVAIERDDLEAVNRYAAESDRLAASLVAGFDTAAFVEQDGPALLDEVRRMNARILEEVETNRLAVAAEIERSSALRAVLRTHRSTGPAGGESLDRES